MARAALTPAGVRRDRRRARVPPRGDRGRGRAAPATGRTIGDVRGDAIIVGVRHADGSFLPQPPGDTGAAAPATSILALGQAAHARAPREHARPAAERRARDRAARRPARRARRRRSRTSPADGGRADVARPRSSARGRPTTATTRRTPRCCSRRRSARRRARSPSGSATRSQRPPRRRARARRGRRPGLPEPHPRRRLVRRRARPTSCARRRRLGRRRRRRRRCSVNIEFVSANPTGPAARRRRAQRRLRRRARAAAGVRGPRVHREFYVNDDGTQIAPARRVDPARARGEEPPEDGYEGDYVGELAARDRGRRRPARRARSPGSASRSWSRRRERSLARFRVLFDVWFSERSLHEGDAEPGRARASTCSTSRAAPYRAGRRAVAAHHRLRRRQGPRPRALQRRAHLLRERHRLPPGQARARLRPADRRAGAPTTTATSRA